MAKTITISLADIKQYRPTAELDGMRWEPFALEAHDLDLRPILGDGLYYDFMTKYKTVADPMYADYQTLLNGGSYTYNGQTIYFDGIKPLMVYLTLSRFVQNNPVHITRFGIVQKTSPQSQPVEATMLRQVVNELKSNASNYRNQVETFLLQNQTTYPLYIGANTSLATSFRIFKG